MKAKHNRSQRIIDRIQSLATDPDALDDDEPVPPPFVVRQITETITRAAEILDSDMPRGIVSTFFGEINVTWKGDDTLVRLACFPDQPSRVQTGRLSAPLGSYRSTLGATPELLVDAITALTLGSPNGGGSVLSDKCTEEPK